MRNLSTGPVLAASPMSQGSMGVPPASPSAIRAPRGERPPVDVLRIFSWNVNGFRAVVRKNALQKFIDTEKPDILCVQEIKAKPNQIETPNGYHIFVNSANRPGYSGTATLVSEDYISRFVSPKMYIPDGAEKIAPQGQLFPDAQRMTFLANKSSEETNVAVLEGRILTLDCGKFYLVNVYVPNSKPDLSRLKFRENEWDPEFLRYLKGLEGTKPVIVCGDFNVAHEEIDIARPKTNHHSAGFTDEERQGMTNYLKAGLIDTFRFLHPKTVRYTWWSHWGKARENNVGWRIDYFLISKSLKPRLKDAEIYESITGSDHCPISIELEI